MEDHHQDFRAPPSSPIARAPNRVSSVVNPDEISDFLEHSLHVPNLILPDQIFPNEIQSRSLPEVDIRCLISLENDAVKSFLECIAAFGCVQLVNHGISGDLIRTVSTAAAGIFGLSRDEDFDIVEETETSEEFVWSREDGLKSVIEEITLPSFSNEMDGLSTEIEKMARQVLSTLLKHGPVASNKLISMSDKQEHHRLVCHLHKHHRYTSINRCDGSMKSDFIRMLIRGSSDYSHVLCVHICPGSSEFHVYSKKGWISFTPTREAIVMTIGDQVQAWSGGHYKNVTGRPIFKLEDEEPISLAFLYSPPIIIQRSLGKEANTISLGQQFILALFLILIYHISHFLYKMC